MNNLGFTVFKHAYLNPSTIASKVAELAKDEFERVSREEVSSITIETVKGRKYTNGYLLPVSTSGINIGDIVEVLVPGATDGGNIYDEIGEVYELEDENGTYGIRFSDGHRPLGVKREHLTVLFRRFSHEGRNAPSRQSRYM